MSTDEQLPMCRFKQSNLGLFARRHVQNRLGSSPLSELQCHRIFNFLYVFRGMTNKTRSMYTY
jgi:hypothetical protein